MFQVEFHRLPPLLHDDFQSPLWWMDWTLVGLHESSIKLCREMSLFCLLSDICTVVAGIPSNLHVNLHTSSHHWQLSGPQLVPRPHTQQLQQRHTAAKDKSRYFKLKILNKLRDKLFLRARGKKFSPGKYPEQVENYPRWFLGKSLRSGSFIS